MIHIHDVNFEVEGKPILRGITASIMRGECVGLTGPSGCGKSTLARIIAGHTHPTRGRIEIDGRDVHAPNRDIMLVHQEDDLFPWQRVRDQIAFPLKMRGKKHEREYVRELIELVRLEGSERKFPNELSGGMKKRLAIARALAVAPKLLILDEAFSSLDSGLKRELHEDLLRIWKKTHATILLITHDKEDLMNLASREIRLSQEHPTNIEKIVDL